MCNESREKVRVADRCLLPWVEPKAETTVEVDELSLSRVAAIGIVTRNLSGGLNEFFTTDSHE